MGMLSVWLLSSTYSIFILLPLLVRVGQWSFEPELADVLLLIIVIVAGPVAMPTSLPEKYVSVVQKAMHR